MILPRCYILLSVLWLAAIPLRAQLGVPLALAEKNYGPATTATASKPATMARTFRFGGMTIEAEFAGDHIGRITYRRPAKFSDEEIQELLDASADLRTWQAEADLFNPVRASTGVRAWRRSDRGGATLSRQGEGDAALDVFVLTDGAFTIAKLKLVATPKTGPVVITDHTLTWLGYDGTGDTAAARFIFDREDIGAGAKGLATLKERIAALPPKSVVKVVPYYGDPGASLKRKPPLDLAELRAFAATKQIVLTVAQGR